jgi:hypothetical protein
MDGEEFKRIRSTLKLGAAALGHALGYEGSDANIARTVYRLESGRSIPKPIWRLMAMFGAFGVPVAWVGEVAQRKHSERPKWANEAVAPADYGQETIVDVAAKPAPPAPPPPPTDHGPAKTLSRSRRCVPAAVKAIADRAAGKREM